mgnify:CR=1 FL=1
MKIVLKNITKKYKNKEVLSHLNFEFDNKIYAFIGHNGSGKSTLMRIITGLIEPTQGEVIFYQNDKIIDYKKVKFGYLSQEFNAFKEFTVYEQLEYFAIMKKINKKVYSNEIKKVLVEVNLWENKDVKCKNLSGGMIRRLGIAQTLLGSPDVIILDEPVVGLDPDERMRFMEIIKSIQLDIPIIFSTHIIDDISSSFQVEDHFLLEVNDSRRVSFFLPVFQKKRYTLLPLIYIVSDIKRHLLNQ